MLNQLFDLEQPGMNFHTNSLANFSKSGHDRPNVNKSEFFAFKFQTVPIVPRKWTFPSTPIGQWPFKRELQSYQEIPLCRHWTRLKGELPSIEEDHKKNCTSIEFIWACQHRNTTKVGLTISTKCKPYLIFNSQVSVRVKMRVYALAMYVVLPTLQL